MLSSSTLGSQAHLLFDIPSQPEPVTFDVDGNKPWGKAQPATRARFKSEAIYLSELLFLAAKAYSKQCPEGCIVVMHSLTLAPDGRMYFFSALEFSARQSP